MVVYADVLFITNLIINYFLLLLSARILNKSYKVYRVVLSALVGAVCSFYIFLPPMALFFEVLFKVCICFLSVLIAFGFKDIKGFLKSGGVFFITTCAFGGIMTVIFKAFKPKGMAVYNSVVYFNVSPLLLVGLTVGFYFAFVLLRYIFSRHAQRGERYHGKILADGKEVAICGLADSGNSLTDIFARSEIIIVEKSRAAALFGETDISINPDLAHRFRPIPLNTVSGTEILDGFRCDSAVIYADKEIRLEKPIIAISSQSFKDDYNAILNPQIFS